MALELGPIIGTIGGGGLDWQDAPAADWVAPSFTLTEPALVVAYVVDPHDVPNIAPDCHIEIEDLNTSDSWLSMFVSDEDYQAPAICAWLPAGDFIIAAYDADFEVIPSRYAIIPI